MLHVVVRTLSRTGAYPTDDELRLYLPDSVALCEKPDVMSTLIAQAQFASVAFVFAKFYSKLPACAADVPWVAPMSLFAHTLVHEAATALSPGLFVGLEAEIRHRLITAHVNGVATPLLSFSMSRPY